MPSPEIKNRRASFEYAFLQKFEAGIVLTGSEVKSLRLGKANISDAYCFLQSDELFIKNMHISGYDQASHFDHDPLRLRKLLLNKKEISKLVDKIKDVGLTIIPIRLFFNDRGFAKIEIALAKGKKNYDKREDIKTREVKREMDRGEA